MPETSILPTPQGEATHSVTAVDVDVTAVLRSITDPWKRSRMAAELMAQLREVRQIRDEAIRELVHQHNAVQAVVAAHLGVNRSRVGQVAGPRVAQLVHSPATSEVAA